MPHIAWPGKKRVTGILIPGCAALLLAVHRHRGLATVRRVGRAGADRQGLATHAGADRRPADLSLAGLDRTRRLRHAAGRFRPQWMARSWFSTKYYGSPMPHSIFFHKGYAIHGTNHISRLGGPASHGCCGCIPARPQACALVKRTDGEHRPYGSLSYSMTISPIMPSSAWVLPSFTMPQRRSFARPAATGTSHHSAAWPG